DFRPLCCLAEWLSLGATEKNISPSRSTGQIRVSRLLPAVKHSPTAIDKAKHHMPGEGHEHALLNDCRR
ncbi:hypothetical protein, partial [Kineosporia babensis]